jgi:hypothetical protein
MPQQGAAQTHQAAVLQAFVQRLQRIVNFRASSKQREIEIAYFKSSEARLSLPRSVSDWNTETLVVTISAFQCTV